MTTKRAMLAVCIGLLVAAVFWFVRPAPAPIKMIETATAHAIGAQQTVARDDVVLAHSAAVDTSVAHLRDRLASANSTIDMLRKQWKELQREQPRPQGDTGGGDVGTSSAQPAGTILSATGSGGIDNLYAQLRVAAELADKQDRAISTSDTIIEALTADRDTLRLHLGWTRDSLALYRHPMVPIESQGSALGASSGGFAARLGNLVRDVGSHIGCSAGVGATATSVGPAVACGFTVHF